ncbi:hypothetical protein OAT00_03730 [Pelagibacteraceae bacterium]|nr:hypothetical protein [Pelagibacteraceae bacterium]
MKKIKVGVIIDNNLVTKWQLNSLIEINDLVDIKFIYNCQNTKQRKKICKNFFYYILNFLSIKNKLSQKKGIKHLKNLKYINFNSTYNNNGWQSLPENILNNINKNVDAIIKFGMNLIHVSKKLKIKYGILSFHHGDPERYRGRPAAFYEILNREKKVGLILQQLNNELDGGTIVESGYSKIYYHSYKKTLEGLYSISPFILKRAFLNLKKGIYKKNYKKGKIYFLPNNLLVLKFFFLLIKNKIIRLSQIVFFYKKWNIGYTKRIQLNSFKKNFRLIKLQNFTYPPIDRRYKFYADPFFFNDKNILVEAFHKKKNKGEIILIDKENFFVNKILKYKNHLSYPGNFFYKKSQYLIPEMAGNDRQFLIQIDKNFEILKTIKLNLKKLIDPTYFYFNKTHFIFASPNQNSLNLLNLYYSKKSLKKFVPHPYNPIVIDPSLSRMGGQIFKHKGALYRFGQNNSENYGQSLVCIKIEKLDDKSYKEKKIFDIKINSNSVDGPHTLNFNSKQCVIDFYKNTFSPLAFWHKFLYYFKYKK